MFENKNMDIDIIYVFHPLIRPAYNIISDELEIA